MEHLPIISCCYPFAGAELRKEEEFQGKLPSKASTVFVLNCFSLVGIVDEPYLVVHLFDIELVNMAKLKPGEVDMTVVFRDFKRDPVQINSIPLDSLDLIKKRFNSGSVKYIENCNEDLDWDSILKERADFPGKFYEEKGWVFYDLEDSKPKDLYRYYYAKPEVPAAADLELEDD